jgi:acyl-CoA synthetase (AMP-forming)/AMP-acid ligase II
MQVLNDPDLTAAAPDGWLRTGDVGYVSDRGHLFVTGRRTDLIVLSSGKKVALRPRTALRSEPRDRRDLHPRRARSRRLRRASGCAVVVPTEHSNPKAS